MSRPNSRYQRSSFQGLSVIEGERKFSFGEEENVLSTASKARDAVNRDFQLYKDRNERRRRTSSLAQSHQIRDIIAKTVEELSRKSDEEPNFKSAEDRLQEVLTEAKESGNSSEKIFSLFGNFKIDEVDPADKESSDESVSKQSFIAGLKKLGSYVWRDDELEYIANKFDVNGDGFISQAEFQHYCYHEITSVAWRAERQRLENATDNGKLDVNVPEGLRDSRFDIKEIIYPCGPEMHKTSKLFWKIDLNVVIVLRYCKDLDIITMQIHDAQSKEDYKSLYIRKKDCALNKTSLDDAAELAVQTSGEKNDECKQIIRNNVHWEFYSNYLVARLQMTKYANNGCESYFPSLTKLHGDEYTSLAIEKPANMTAPQNRSDQDRASWKGKSIEDEFRSRVKSFQRESRSARTSRQSAQELTSLISMALDEIQLEDYN